MMNKEKESQPLGNHKKMCSRFSETIQQQLQVAENIEQLKRSIAMCQNKWQEIMTYLDSLPRELEVEAAIDASLGYCSFTCEFEQVSTTDDPDIRRLVDGARATSLDLMI